MNSPRAGVYGLLLAQGISTLGTRMSFLAVPWFVLTTTGSASMAGLVAFSEMLPYVLAQGLGGPLVDRIGPLRMSILSDLLAAAAMGIIPLCHRTLGLTPPVLMALLALAGGLRGLGTIARRVLIPPVSERAAMSLEQSSGFMDAISRLAGLLGAPLAGLIIAVSGAPEVLALDALSYLASALIVALTMKGFAVERPASRERYLPQLAAGFRFLAQDRLLQGIAALIVVTNLLDQAYASVLLPVWIQHQGHSPVVLGSLFALFGAGALAGNAFMATMASRWSRRGPFAWGFLLCGAPRFAILAFSDAMMPVLIVVFLAGIGAGAINPILSAVQYEHVPPSLQARVLGVVGALAWAGVPLGSLLGGTLTDQAGLPWALEIGAAIYLGATLAPLVFPVWRRMERDSMPEASVGSHPGGSR